jgi:hypothetical protein
MSSDTSCAQALGLPFTYSPTTDSTLQIPAPIPASQVIDINGLGSTKYMSATPGIPANRFGGLTIAKLAILYDGNTQAVNQSPTLQVKQAHIYVNAVNSAANLSLISKTTGVNLQLDTTQNKITACSGFRLGSGASVDVPNCNSGQLLFANGTKFQCVYSNCLTGWHPSYDTAESGFAAAGTDLRLVDSTLAVDSSGSYRAQVSCAPGNKLGTCGSGPPYTTPTSCVNSNLAYGTATGTCVDASSNPVALPYKPNGWYCPTNCAVNKPSYQYNYCPLNGAANASSWGTQNSPPAGVHTQALCTNGMSNANGVNFCWFSAASISSKQVCQYLFTVNGVGLFPTNCITALTPICPAGWSNLAMFSSTNNGSACGGTSWNCGQGDCCNTGNHTRQNTAVESCRAEEMAACGPAHDGNWKYANANPYEVGCI